MSRSLDIACVTCKKRLWIGQGYGSFYSGMPEVMEALGKFLFEHETTLSKEHVLHFQDDNSTDEWYTDEDWQRVEPSPPTTNE